MKRKKILLLKLVNIHKLKWFMILTGIMFPFSGQAQSWSLQQCIDTAMVYNKNIQISRNNMDIGTQKKKEAMSQLAPKINVTGDYKYFTDLPYQLMPLSTFNPTAAEGQFKEAQFGVPHNISASIQLTVPLYNPQIYGGIAASKIASGLTELQYDKTAEQVFFEISNLYYNVQILQHQLSFIDSNLVNTTMLLQKMQLLKQQSMVKGTDVMKVELQLEQLKTQREIVANNAGQVLNALKLSMGISLNRNIQIDPEIHFTDADEYSHVPTVDMQIADVQNRLLKSELKTLKNSGLPSVSLYGSYGQSGFGYDQKPNDFLKFFPSSFAGIQVSIPLFNSTKHPKINQKMIEIRNSELNLSIIRDQNEILTDNAESRRAVARKNIANTSSQTHLAKLVYEQTLLHQKEGTSGLTDVLLADSALREAQQHYLSAIIEYLKADLELKKLTGNISLKN